MNDRQGRAFGHPRGAGHWQDVGLDDNWQACGAGVDGSFFDANGNPLINTATFPDMKGMVQYAHSRGLNAGFYMVRGRGTRWPTYLCQPPRPTSQLTPCRTTASAPSTT